MFIHVYDFKAHNTCSTELSTKILTHGWNNHGAITKQTGQKYLYSTY